MCETFPSSREAACAVRAARETGLAVWASLTAGYEFSDLDVEAEEKGEDYSITYKDQMHGPRIGIKARF